MTAIFEEYPMLIFALEALVALALLIFIVWWTMSGAKRGPQRPLRAPRTSDDDGRPPERPDPGDRSAHDRQRR